MKILLIDNYDSFTYNLVHYLEQVTEDDVRVVRNDEILASEVGDYDLIMLSPGPGLPSDAGITMEVLQQWHRTKNIFGVCLGHQAIGEFFGAKLRNLDEVHHGVATPIEIIAADVLYKTLPTTIDVGRYHSWVIDEALLPDQLVVTARDQAGEIMSVRHREFQVCGVQFHPESIMTPHGLQIIRNWVEHAKVGE